MYARFIKMAGYVCLYGFAFAGFFLIAGFLAVKFHLTDTLGAIDLNDRYFAKTAAAINAQTTSSSNNLSFNLCRARILQKFYPANGAKILDTYRQTKSNVVLAKMLASAELYASDNSEYQKAQAVCVDEEMAEEIATNESADGDLYAWVNTDEWQTLKIALGKDTETINRVAEQMGVPSRLIVAQIVGEQLRLFNDNREVFKQFFQPLKILGNEVQFSLGVAGIKEETAKKIEQNLKDASLPYYLGSQYESLLDFQTDSPDQERFARLTDEHDHTYSYLYTALFIKQIETQWQKAGFDISDRPEILATIFNIGFEHSVPKADPQVGGSEIEMAGHKYTFGSLAYEFYYSGEMEDEFPMK